MIVNIFFILVICYLAYHLVYGKFNIQNYLVYKFEEKIWKQKQETLDKNIADVAMDLNALRLGQEDYLEELEIQKNPLPNEGETVLKLDWLRMANRHPTNQDTVEIRYLFEQLWKK